MPEETPDLGALLAEAIAAARGSIATGLPATVLAYDPVRQTITAKPAISARYQDPDSGTLVPFPLPAIPNVPVAFPSGGGFSFTWDLFEGDPVYLVFADSSLDEWKSSGAAENEPQDTRRFDLTDAVAIPGVRSFANPIPVEGWAAGAAVIRSTDIRLGASTATAPVALATLAASVSATLKTWLDTHTHAPGAALAGLLSWLATHTHTGVTTGVGVTGPPLVVPDPVPPSGPTGTPVVASPTADSVAATRVKAI